MSAFDDRVWNIAHLAIDDRFKALSKLDPEMAVEYALGIASGNKARIRDGAPLIAGGPDKIDKADVDAIMAAAVDDNVITKEEEEALLIIAATERSWAPGAKDYLIELIEKNLKLLWSTSPISSDEAARLLLQTNRLDFVSAGDKHQGTGLHYTPMEYQLVVHLIERKAITAWEISRHRSFKQIWALDDSTCVYYTQDNVLYLLEGLSPRDRQCSFVHESTHAIQDFRNITAARSPNKYTETDAYIADAFVALALGVPYAAFPNEPDEVASREGGAAAMLLTPVASRTAKWKSDFRKAYDKVVDAYSAGVGTARANKPMPLENSETLSDENFMVAMWEALNGI
jgi:hypothetical protein